MRAAHIAFASADNFGFGGELTLFGFAIREQQIFLPHLASGELFRQRTIGNRRLSEDQHAARLLVEAMEDGNPAIAGPTRLAMLQPFVNPLARVRRRRVSVPTSRFVDHEQMLVFVDDAGRNSCLSGRRHSAAEFLS